VRINWGRQEVAAALSELMPSGADKESRQEVENWHYWVEMGYDL